jgi:protein-tyrosine-phosphatase
MSQVKRPHAVLFVCTQNAIRSPMAAAMAHQIAGHQTYVASAGVQAGDPDPFAAVVMDEIGLDLTRHRPHSLDDLADSAFDLVITLSPEAQVRVAELAKTSAFAHVHWDTPDPSAVQGSREMILEAYRAVRDQLNERVRAKLS